MFPSSQAVTGPRGLEGHHNPKTFEGVIFSAPGAPPRDAPRDFPTKHLGVAPAHINV